MDRRMMYSRLVKVSGEQITAQKCRGAHIPELSVLGKSTQKTLTGKQLIDVDESLFPETTNGVTATYNAQTGEITLNGTVTGVAENYVRDIYIAPANSIILPAGTYTLSGGVSGGGTYTYRLFLYNTSAPQYIQDFGEGTTFTVPEERAFGLTIRFGGEMTEPFNNMVFRPMLVSGSKVIPWEPYIGGQPMPSPMNPSPVVHAGEKANIFDYSTMSERIYAYLMPDMVYWGYADDSYSIRVPCEPNKKYLVAPDATYLFYRMAWVDSNDIPAAGVSVRVYDMVRLDDTIPREITTGANAKYIIIQIPSSEASEKLKNLTVVEVANITVTANNGNMFDMAEVKDGFVSQASTGEKMTIGHNETYPNAQYQKIPVKPGDTLYFKWYGGDSTVDSLRVRFAAADGVTTTFVRYSDYNNIVINENTRWVYVMSYSKSFNVNDRHKLWVSTLAPAPEVFAPRREQHYIIPVTGGLPGIGDYRDEIVVYPDGSGKYIQRVYCLDADNLANHIVTLQSINGYGIANFGVAVGSAPFFRVSDALCTHLPPQTEVIAVADSEGVFMNNTRFYIRLNQERASTVDEFKAWFTENNVKVYAAMQTPIETALTAEEMKLYTYSGTTVITNDAGAGMEVTYRARQ